MSEIAIPKLGHSVLYGRAIPAIFGLLIAAPIMATVLMRYHAVDVVSELTIYRIGNAVSLMFGEDTYVSPVQGLPIALLAKLEVKFLSLIGLLAISPKMLTIYQAIYFGVMFGSSIAAMIWAWPVMSQPQRSAILLLFACPWILGGGSVALIIEPDYWVGEWTYLVISFCLLQILSEKKPSLRIAGMIGAWLAIGAAMKITLLGIAPFFLFSQHKRLVLSLTSIAISFAATYFALAWLYMGHLSNAISLLQFQAEFFVHPNVSFQWSDPWSALAAHPFVPFLIAAFALVSIISQPTKKEFATAVLWAGMLAYLFWKRPHDTSIASAATILTFLVAFLIRSAKSAVIALVLLITGAAASNFDRLNWIDDTLRNGWSTNPKLDLPEIHGMFYVPDNYWNAGLMVQAVGFNGMLGFYYRIENGTDGMARYQEAGKAFGALAPGVVLIPNTEYALDVAVRALRSGEPLWWTQREHIPDQSLPSNLTSLQWILKEADASVTSYPFRVNGEDWILYKTNRIPELVSEER